MSFGLVITNCGVTCPNFLGSNTTLLPFVRDVLYICCESMAKCSGQQSGHSIFLNAFCVHNPFIFVFLYLQRNDNSFSIPIHLLLIPPEEEAALVQMSGKPNKKPSQFSADTVCKTKLTISLWLTISSTFPCSSLYLFFPSWTLIPPCFPLFLFIVWLIFWCYLKYHSYKN